VGITHLITRDQNSTPRSRFDGAQTSIRSHLRDDGISLRPGCINAAYNFVRRDELV